MRRFIILLVTAIIAGGAYSDGISKKCLDCICTASTGCNAQEKCHHYGPRENMRVCGPYHISHQYWSDSGRPSLGDGSPGGYEECANDMRCATKSVKAYMDKFASYVDCDRDGTVNCFDYARIHNGGRSSCPALWVDSSPFWALFVDCMKSNHDQ